MSKEIIAVIAHKGMVGATTFDYYKEKGYRVMGWSRSSQTHEWDDICIFADYIFVCVPTPFDWNKKKINLSAIEETLKILNTRKLKKDCKVIIKSTIPPKTTQNFQSKYKKLNLLFNPEFLSEATASTDFANPDRQIVGYTDKTYKYATEVLHMLPNSPHDVIMTSTEAEIVKYVNNFHGALMVVFANFFYDICEKTGAEFETVKVSSQASKWVGSPMGRMYWNINHGGFRGYGGKCFPKDMNTLANWCEDNNLDCTLLLATIIENRALLENQKLTESIVENYSKRT